jgi:hypothetical protein
MAARQLRWLLLGELLIYGVLGFWLVARGRTPLEAAGFGVAVFLAVRLCLVLATFGLMLRGASPVPEKLRIGPLQALRMVFEEWAALIVLFTVIQPFERFWLGPDRLGHCATRPLPLLLIHGYQCNRGFWIWMRWRLEAAGWTVATHSMEPVWTEIDNYADGIERRIDEVLAATGAPQVILVCHSMGGPGRARLPAPPRQRQGGTHDHARLGASRHHAGGAGYRPERAADAHRQSLAGRARCLRRGALAGRLGIHFQPPRQLRVSAGDQFAPGRRHQHCHQRRQPSGYGLFASGAEPVVGSARSIGLTLKRSGTS